MTEPYLGEIRIFGFPRIPVGWHSCDGTLLSISENDALYVLLGTTYGGDGVSTFGLPDLRGQTPIHQGRGPGLSPRVLGQTGGVESVTLTTAQMPAHSHLMNASQATATASTPGATTVLGSLTDGTQYLSDLTGYTAIPLSATAVQPTGGSQPHDNTMPTLTVSICIATAGIFPSQS